jgi:hypothetical protein
MDEQDIGASDLTECGTCDLRYSTVTCHLACTPPASASAKTGASAYYDSGTDSEPGIRSTDLSVSAACPIGAE